MATVKEFVEAMETLVRVHSVYIGTGNGELLVDIPIGKIFTMEKNYGRRDSAGNPLWWSDTARDFEFIAKCYRLQYDMTQSKAGDCSGQIVGVLRALGVIKPTADYRAKDFQNLATVVAMKNLQPGDLVFDQVLPADGKSVAGHIGVYVGSGMVIDCRGRDVGVIKRSIDNYPWKGAGRLDWFDGSTPPLTRNLKYTPDYLMRGEDVRQCQERLGHHGFPCGEIDGVFGKMTDTSVRQFQIYKYLTVDGIVGQKTWDALWKD